MRGQNLRRISYIWILLILFLFWIIFFKCIFITFWFVKLLNFAYKSFSSFLLLFFSYFSIIIIFQNKTSCCLFYRNTYSTPTCLTNSISNSIKTMHKKKIPEIVLFGIFINFHSTTKYNFYL